MKKRKIAFVTPIYLPANLYGSDMAVRTLAEELAHEGHTVSVITSNAMVPRYWFDPIFGKKIEESYSKINGVEVNRLACNHIKSIGSFLISRMIRGEGRWQDTLRIVASGPILLGLDDILHREQYEIIHVSPFPLYINKQVVDAIDHIDPKPKVIFTPFFHSRVSSYHNSQLDILFAHADKIHTVSHTEKHDIESEYASARGKTIVIPLFQMHTKLHTKVRIQDKIIKFQVSHGLNTRIVILFVGIKGQMKGALDVLSAVLQLYDKDKRFMLIAIGHNTTEWNTAIRGIGKDVLLNFGYVDDMLKEVLIGASDMVCIPSKSESFGLVYLEAWQKKKPVIAADIPAVRELVGNAGILVPYNNVSLLMEAIMKLGYNNALREKLGDIGYRRLNLHYTSSRLMRSYRTLFYA